MNSHKFIGFLIFCVGLGSASAEDFREKGKAALRRDEIPDTMGVVKKPDAVSPYDFDLVTETALGLARASGGIPKARIPALVQALSKREKIPADISNSWQKLLRIAYVHVNLEQRENFFSTGYEFEVVHPQISASDDFGAGVKAYSHILSQTFGLNRVTRFADKVKMYDDGGRKWDVVTEYGRFTDNGPSAWEIGTPPMMRAEELQSMSPFIWKLGASPFGTSRSMTGLHQTYGIVPRGASADSKLVARTAANLMVLQSQFAPAIFELLDVQRNGGFQNMFFRPLVLDHLKLLQDLGKANTRSFDAQKLSDLLFDSHIEIENTVQAANQLKVQVIDEDDYKERIAAPREELREWKSNWKYRDGQVKLNVENPERTLFEVRIGDYVDDSPEKPIKQTYLYQYILDAAFREAQAGRIFQIDVPERDAKESDWEYWQRLKLEPKMTAQALFKTVGITNPNDANFLMNKSFLIEPNRISIGEEMTLAFEVEGWTNRLTEVVVPRDPELRAKWRGLTPEGRRRAMVKMGLDPEAGFSAEWAAKMKREFRVDTDRFPFLSNQLVIEASGNWEIKTKPFALKSLGELEKSLGSVAKVLGKGVEQFGGVHMHLFVPDRLAAKMKAENASKFAATLGRLSAYDTLLAYSEADPSEPYHALDSWSLDRYSAKDLEAVSEHLKGNRKLNAIDQKYHNIAFRPLKGGVDIEVRNISDDVEYGINMIRRVGRMVSGEYGDPEWADSPALFHEFRDSPLKDVRRFTLEEALSAKYSLTKQQKELLRKMQFEIYKPSMSDFMYFKDYSGLGETAPKDLDPAFVRTNFETNVAIPLLNYEEQKYLSKGDLEKIAEGRERFLERVYKKLLAVESNASYEFMKDDADFLYLADYLRSSTHAHKPKFKTIPRGEIEARQALLEDLTQGLRSDVIRFVQETQVQQMIGKSIPKPMRQKDAIVLPKAPKPEDAIVATPVCDDLELRRALKRIFGSH